MNKKQTFVVCVLVIVIFAMCLFVACDDKGDGGEKAEIGFLSGAGGIIDGQTMSLEVGTTVDTVDLASVIYMKGNASYTVCEDENGELVVPDKKISLTKGDNTFYVIVNLDGNEVIYTLNVWKNFYTNIYYYVDGDLFDSQSRVLSHTYLEDFRAPENLEYGIEFLGWDCEGYYVTEVAKSFHAKLKFKTVTVQLNANGGECAESVQVNLGGKFELPIPTREGYKFMGWVIEMETLTPASFIADSYGKGFYKWTIEEDNVVVSAMWV